MGKVLKADASAAEAYVEIDLGAPVPVASVTFQLLIPAAAAALWAAGTSGLFVRVRDSGHGDLDFVRIVNNNWGNSFGTPDTDPPPADAWTACEALYVNDDGMGNTVWSFYVTAVQELSDSAPGPFGEVQFVQIGLAFVTPDPAAIVYFDDVKVGSASGDDDLFSDDFEDGTLDAWTTTEGAVSVVDDPLAPPEPSEPPELVVSAVTGIVPHSFGEGDVRARLAVTGSAARRPIRDLQDQNVQVVTIRVAAGTGPSHSFQVFGVEVTTLPADPHETGGQ